jgi:5-methylcytosine-specific restriction protein A
MSQLRGFPPVIRKRIKDRAGVEGDFVRCERCGVWAKNIQLHHRRPRALGGSRLPETNLPANGLAVCPMCHMWAEKDRANALERGFLVPQHRTPAEVPVFRQGEWVMLANDGTYLSIPEPAGGRVA